MSAMSTLVWPCSAWTGGEWTQDMKETQKRKDHRMGKGHGMGNRRNSEERDCKGLFVSKQFGGVD